MKRNRIAVLVTILSLLSGGVDHAYAFSNCAAMMTGVSYFARNASCCPTDECRCHLSRSSQNLLDPVTSPNTNFQRRPILYPSHKTFLNLHASLPKTIQSQNPVEKEFPPGKKFYDIYSDYRL